jgi:hypothetical protein
MPSYDEVRETVANSEFHEWISFANCGTWTYQPDVDIRISREEQIDSRYQQPWTAQMQGQNSRFEYYVFHGTSPVEYHVIVSVDDGRAHIPEPQPPQGGGQFSISQYEANIGQIVTGDVETFNAYLNRTGIVIR